jgi:tetratricopeptide (TPR) repeat protein
VNIHGLVREVRQTGAASDWRGQAAIADAASAIFGDSVIAGLSEAEKLDEFAVAVTTSWVLLSAADEYLAGVDINFLEIDPNSADGWGVSTASMERLLVRVTEIYQTPGSPAAVASLAAFIALSLDEHADRAIDVWSATRDWAGAQPGDTPESRASPQADYLFREFGDPSRWRDGHADALAKALEVIYQYCTDKAAERPAPEFPSEPFSADDDQLFRQLITGRLCRLWTARSSVAMPWRPACHQALLPFAGYVAARASTDRTRDLAILLGNISLAARGEALRRKRLLDWISQIPNAGQFARRLYRRGLFVAPVLGALFALIGEVIPDWLAAFVATVGLIAVIRLASSARRSARYTAMTYPAANSLLAGVLLSGLYCAGETFSLWLQNGAGGGSVVPGLVVGFVIGAGTLTLAVRYGAPFKVSRSVFLPDGAPDDLEDQFAELSDKLSEWVASRLESAHSSWTELLEQGSPWAPSALGRPQQVLAASAETVAMFRRLAQANPVGFDPGFGASLQEYSLLLYNVGRREEAATVAAEAVQVRSRLATKNPGYQSALGNSLLFLCGTQSDTGRPMEALPGAQRALQIFIELAQAGVASYDVQLARCLTILGQIFLQIGQTEDGLSCEQDAIQILRPLSEDAPELRVPLSSALTLAGAMLSATGRTEDGLACEEEAIHLLRALPPASQDLRGRLGRSLTLAGAMLLEGGRPADAMASTEEAIRILRPLTQDNPFSYAEVLATALGRRGEMLSDDGRREEALASVEEAVHVLRPVALAHLPVNARALGIALGTLGEVLSEAGRPQEGLASMAEAVQVLRPVGYANADEALLFAAVLAGLGEMLANAARPQEGLACLEEAAQILRPLALADPAAMADNLAEVLESTDKVLSAMGLAEASLACMEEAAGILRPLAEADPALHAVDFARSLAVVADKLQQAGRLEEALLCEEEAMRILDRLPDLS